MVGVRDEESFNSLAKAYPDLITIAIIANVKMRYSRDCSKHATTPTNPLSLSQFRLRDRLHVSWGLSKLIATADFTLENSGTLTTLRQRVNSLSRQLAITLGETDDKP